MRAAVQRWAIERVLQGTRAALARAHSVERVLEGDAPLCECEGARPL